jgi:hypothetical protein
MQVQVQDKTDPDEERTGFKMHFILILAMAHGICIINNEIAVGHLTCLYLFYFSLTIISCYRRFIPPRDIRTVSVCACVCECL